MKAGRSFLRPNPTGRALEVLVRDSPLDAAELARRAELTQVEAAAAIAWLLTSGLVRDTVRDASPGAGALDVDPGAAAFAVVDLGGSNVRAAIADLTGNLLSREREPTDPRGGMHVVEQVAALCHRATRLAGLPRSRIRAAAVGVPGVPAPDSGSIRMAPNIDGLDCFDVRTALSEAIGVDTVLENDVNAALLGECWAGDSKGIRDLVYVKVGTGIGAGILCNGEVVRGFRGAGGQISAMPFGADPEDAESLRAGALERVTAGKGIVAHYRAFSGIDFAATAIFDRAASGDAAAITALEEASRFLALALGATCALTDPERIVLGGSIGRRQEIVERVSAGLARIHPDPATVVAETPGFEAALLGCLRLCLLQLSAALDDPPAALPAPP